MSRAGGWPGSRPDSAGDDPGGREVDALFELERAAIDDLPGDEVHWQAILRAGRRGQHRWPAYVASAAAALVVAAGAGLAFQGSQAGRSPSADPSSRTAVLSSPPQASATPSPTSPTSSTAPASTAGTLRVPVSFSIVSMSNGGGGNLFGLGSATCPAGPCTAVVGSSDDGHTWSTRASFTGLTTPGLAQNASKPDQLTGVRFANARVGYAFGSAARRTIDGGRSWRGFDVGGAAVLSLETDGQTVWLVTARSCQPEPPAQPGVQTPTGAAGCTGLAVESATVGESAAHVVPVPGLPSSVRTAWIVMDGKDAYLNAQTRGDGSSAPATPVRLTGTPGSVARPAGCDPKGDVWLVTTARDRGALFAVCAEGSKAKYSVSMYAVFASADRGQSWRPRGVGGLGPVSEHGVWATAADRDHLVAIPGGLPATDAAAPSGPATVGAGLLASEDGGATWHSPAVSSKAGGWGWAGAAGGPIVYALDGGGRYFLSTDRGASFEQVTLRR